MTGPAYPAAHAVAQTVEAHFARHLAAALAQGQPELAPPPSARIIEAIIDVAFWASLRREEGVPPKISLAFLPPEQAGSPMTFGRRLPLDSSVITRLAPAVVRPGIHLCLWHDGDELYVWGATRTIPRLCFVLEVIEPGLLVIKHRRAQDEGKFANVAVLQADQIKVIDEEGASIPDCPTLVTSLLGFESPASWVDSVNVLVQMAVSMRAHGHGGTLLVVPAGSEAWQGSIVYPIPYPVVPAFAGLAEVARREMPDGGERRWQESLRRAVDAVAGLTAVDGAVVIDSGYSLLAFGAKIGRGEGKAPVDQVMLTEPIVGAVNVVLHPAQMGGTRHLSAAQFAHDQRDAVALVASQDGRFTIFAWSPCEQMVHAHRVEALLL